MYSVSKNSRNIQLNSWDPGIKPLVSICCLTYAHENFIRDAIEGFLTQKTTFGVEIIIYDDASPDSTADIVRSYELEYPELIRAIYQSENQYSKGIEPAQRFLFPAARGSYIALCEGDDYWTDPLKLQKQIEFLERHPDFSTCVGGYTRLIQDTGRIKKVIVERESLRYRNGFEFTLQEMQREWLTKTLTAVFRRCVLEEIDLSVYEFGRDIHLFYHLIKHHKAFYLSEDLGVYRVHAGGVNSMKEEKVNTNVAYRCYRELHLHNKDDFTRILYLKSTLTLLNFNFFNRHDGNGLRANLQLFLEAVSLIRRFSEIKLLFTVIIKNDWKEKIKHMAKKSTNFKLLHLIRH